MWAFLSKMIVFYGLVQYSWAVCLSVCSKYSIQFYHLLRHSCRIGSFTMKIDWRLALKRKQNVLFCFPLLSREKKRQKKRCWNPQKGLAFHTAKRSVSRSGDRSQKSLFTIGLLDDESNFQSAGTHGARKFFETNVTVQVVWPLSSSERHWFWNHVDIVDLLSSMTSWTLRN